MDRKASDSIVTVIGIDIGKNTFHLVVLDKRGAIALRQKLSRGQGRSRCARSCPAARSQLGLQCLLLTANGATFLVIEIDRDLVDLAREREGRLVGEVHGRANVLTNIQSFTS
jgi:hypothetical protein